jgi:hypothetical protein
MSPPQVVQYSLLETWAAKLMSQKISGNLIPNLIFNTTVAFRSTAGCNGFLKSGGISARQLDESPALRGLRQRDSAHRLQRCASASWWLEIKEVKTDYDSG